MAVEPPQETGNYMQMASTPKMRNPQKLTAGDVKDRAIKRGKGQNPDTTTMSPGGYNFGNNKKPAQTGNAAARLAANQKKGIGKVHTGGSKPKAPPIQYNGY